MIEVVAVAIGIVFGGGLTLALTNRNFNRIADDYDECIDGLHDEIDDLAKQLEAARKEAASYGERLVKISIARLTEEKRRHGACRKGGLATAAKRRAPILAKAEKLRAEIEGRSASTNARQGIN